MCVGQDGDERESCVEMYGATRLIACACLFGGSARARRATRICEAPRRLYGLDEVIWWGALRQGRTVCLSYGVRGLDRWIDGGCAGGIAAPHRDTRPALWGGRLRAVEGVPRTRDGWMEWERRIMGEERKDTSRGAAAYRVL